MAAEIPPPLSPDHRPSGNVAIRVLGIPQTGARSRVETQLKIMLSLYDPVSGSPVSCTKPISIHPDLLFNPNRPASRHRSKKQLNASIIANSDTSTANTSAEFPLYLLESGSSELFLTARVESSSDPSKIITVCESCSNRELRRLLRKRISKPETIVGPRDPHFSATSYSSTIQQRSRRILLISSPSRVDFQSGFIELAVRIPCYSRHNGESKGFHIIFEITDSCGMKIATTQTPPVFITDDHKSTHKIKARAAAKSASLEQSNENLNNRLTPHSSSQLLPAQLKVPNFSNTSCDQSSLLARRAGNRNLSIARPLDAPLYPYAPQLSPASPAINYFMNYAPNSAKTNRKKPILPSFSSTLNTCGSPSSFHISTPSPTYSQASSSLNYTGQSVAPNSAIELQNSSFMSDSTCFYSKCPPMRESPLCASQNRYINGCWSYSPSDSPVWFSKANCYPVYLKNHLYQDKSDDTATSPAYDHCFSPVPEVYSFDFRNQSINSPVGILALDSPRPPCHQRSASFDLPYSNENHSSIRVPSEYIYDPNISPVHPDSQDCVIWPSPINSLMIPSFEQTSSRHSRAFTQAPYG